MIDINWNTVRSSLAERSDIELQKRLWTSDGSDGADVFSFSEAVEQLFTDSGLSLSLDSGETGLASAIDDAFRQLDMEIQKVETHHGPAATTNHHSMIRVRKLSGKLLSPIHNH